MAPSSLDWSPMPNRDAGKGPPSRSGGGGGTHATPQTGSPHSGILGPEAVELIGGPCDGRLVPRDRFFRSPAPFLPEASRLPAYYALVPGQARALFSGRGPREG